jgi:hypothetical protein
VDQQPWRTVSLSPPSVAPRCSRLLRHNMRKKLRLTWSSIIYDCAVNRKRTPRPIISERGAEVDSATFQDVRHDYARRSSSVRPCRTRGGDVGRHVSAELRTTDSLADPGPFHGEPTSVQCWRSRRPSGGNVLRHTQSILSQCLLLLHAGVVDKRSDFSELDTCSTTSGGIAVW